ncbi:MAG: hypothetical protein FD136_1726, partial [Chitinophagaceae bacterium]
KMRKIMGTTAVLLFAIILAAQTNQSIKGIVKDKTTNEPITGAIIRSGKQVVTSNESGNFAITKMDNSTIRISSMGYQSVEFKSDPSNQSILEFALIPNPSYLQPLEVNAIRASDKAPFSKTNLLKT